MKLKIQKSLVAFLSLAAFALSGVSGGAMRAYAGDNDQLEHRKNTMASLEHTLKSLDLYLRDEITPQENGYRHLAEILARLSVVAAGSFAVATPEATGETKAEAKIWTSYEDFSMRMAQFRRDAAQLEKIAQSQDLEAMRAQVRVIGGSCKSCHRVYQSR